ncbi:MAG TPA: PilN domain-containing protein [Gemmatimonadales bacterium]|jgi:Tfp pilus assembly protein PilN|nr:PilN domain-containing protein [Gemmatimonadales bacterium]
MITVNLRPDLKRKRARKPFTGSLDGLRGLGSKVKDPLLLVAVVAWVSVLGWLAFVYMGTTRELNALTPQLEASRSENRRFKAFLTEKRHQETIRDSLVAQIGVIRTVDADRYVWPHLLDEITKALPAYTWLVDVSPTTKVAPPVSAPAPAAKPAEAKAGAKADSVVTAAPAPAAVQVEINGRTVDIQAYTKFLRQLEASPWITDVLPVSAQTVIEKERPVTAFIIRATYKQADSAYIKTVPLSQSVR